MRRVLESILDPFSRYISMKIKNSLVFDGIICILTFCSPSSLVLLTYPSVSSCLLLGSLLLPSKILFLLSFLKKYMNFLIFRNSFSFLTLKSTIEILFSDYLSFIPTFLSISVLYLVPSTNPLSFSTISIFPHLLFCLSF